MRSAKFFFSSLVYNNYITWVVNFATKSQLINLNQLLVCVNMQHFQIAGTT
jgi:hypothetical protein